MAFDSRMTPSLIEAAGTYYLPAAVRRRHGFGPVTDGFLLCRPMGEVRVADVRADGLAAKRVPQPVVGQDHVLRHVRSLYVTDGTGLWVTVAVERLDGAPYLLCGLPYAADDGDRVRRVTDGEVTSGGGLRLTHPAATGPDHFDVRAELTQEQAAFALAADPRGYGDPDEGWGHLVSSTALEAGPAPGAPDGLHVFAVRYGPGGTFEPVFEEGADGLTVRTEAFTATVGAVAGDSRGSPPSPSSAERRQRSGSTGAGNTPAGTTRSARPRVVATSSALRWSVPSTQATAVAWSLPNSSCRAISRRIRSSSSAAQNHTSSRHGRTRAHEPSVTSR